MIAHHILILTSTSTATAIARMFWKATSWWLLVVCVKMAAMHNDTFSDDFDGAEETQHTYCKIATEELQATANATITRELKGVCTSKELKRSMAAILREIQTLKDALIHQAAAGGASIAKQTKRNKRKNVLELFAVPKGRYSYYWTLNDVEQYLCEGASLKSPIITFEEVKYYLRLTIVDRIATVQLVTHSPDLRTLQTYTVYVLSQNGVFKDMRLDQSNAYSASLRRLRQFKRDTDTLFIKLVIE